MDNSTDKEQRRLDALEKYHILDTLPEQELDDMVKLASELCKTPIALISLLDDKRQWFKANVGLDAKETPKDISFCQYAIADGNEGVYEVKNALENSTFSNNPLVTGNPHIRFYAGAPLISPEGYKLGTLCVIDTKPNELNEQQKETLKIISNLVITQFELRKKKEELENSRNAYLSLVEEGGDIIYTSDLKGNFTFISSAAKKVTGYLPQELVGRHFTYLIADDWKERIEKFYIDQFKSGTSKTIQDFPILTKTGEKKWVEQTVVILFDDKGPRGYQGNVRDISKRKLIEAELANANGLFSTLFKSSPLAMVLVSVKTDLYVEVNQAFTEMSGYTRDDLVGHTAIEVEIVTPDVKERMAQILAEKGNMKDMEIPYRNKKTGEIRDLLMTGEMIIINQEKHRLYICEDITEKKRIEKAIKESNERFTKMFKTSPVAMTLSTLNPNKFLEVNDSFTELLGFTLNDVIGKNSADIGLMNLEDRERVAAMFAKQGYLRNHEIKITNIIGEEKYILLSSEIIEFSGARYSMSVYYDISKRKKLEQELIKAKEIAEESSIAKEQFLANMSHEIRTPINGVIGFTDLLEKTKLSNEQKEYVDAVSISGKNLLSIINNILDYSKINSNMMEIEEIPLSIRSTFSSLTILFSQRAKEKKLKLSFEAAKNIPEMVIGDPARLTQIFTNLIGNALKFTEKGYIKAKASLVEKNDKNVKVKFSIEDTGIGIAPNKLSSVFERFSQADLDTNRKYGGTGLGLSIVKKLVELQHGEIIVKSTLGKGSTFEFIIVYKAITEEENKTFHTIQKSNTKVNIKNLRVLLVEDNLVNQKLATRVLEKAGLITELAENGKVAIEKLKKKKFDLIVMDMQMPVMDGYEATSIIRNKMKSDIPIIAMTAHALSSERDRCLGLGMNDYISKPFKSETLYSSVQNLFNKANIANNPKTKQKDNQVKNKGLLDLKQLRDLAGNNEEFISDILTTFIDETTTELKEIKKGIKDKNFMVIKNLAHKQRSSISVIGLNSFDTILAAIENFAMKQKEMNKITALFKEYDEQINIAINEAKLEIKNIKNHK